jgi:protein required for attachment to host cells
MILHRKLCIVAADGEHARFITPAADNALHTTERLDSAAAGQRTSDLVSDRLGRSFESASPTRHAITPRHDPHELEKEKFGREVAARINALGAAGAFDALALVAPPPILGLIQDALSSETRAKLVGTLAKDLATVPDHELQPHLQHWVGPLRRDRHPSKPG